LKSDGGSSSPDDRRSASEKKVDACQKLRALCVRRGLTRSLLGSGTTEIIVGLAEADDSTEEVRVSALQLLLTMVSGHEDDGEQDDSDKSKRQQEMQRGVNKPVEVTDSATDARKKVHALLDLPRLRRICRPYAKAVKQLALVVGYAHAPEDTEALEIINEAIAFGTEAEGEVLDVPRGGITALSAMCDTRRRLGKGGKALMPSAPLLKCLESALGTSSCSESLRVLLATVFVLLADEDRADAHKIDFSDVASRILEPFLASADNGLKTNGLLGLTALLASNSKSGAKVLHTSAAPLTALLTTLSSPPPGAEGRAMQEPAAECLLLATGDQVTRKHLLEGGIVNMVMEALEEGPAETCEGLIRAKFVGVLATLAAHDADCRIEIFDRIDFMMELRQALDAAKAGVAAAKAGTKDTQKQKTAVDEARRLSRALYESCVCLSIHGEFKETLLGAKKTLKAMQELLTPDDIAEDTQLGFLFTSLIYNLCRSREDKIRPKKKEFPFNELGEDDLDALEDFYKKMPAESRPVQNGEVDSGCPEVATQLRAWCMQSGNAGNTVVSHLSKCVGVASPPVKALIANVFLHLCKEQNHRKHMVAGGGFRALLSLCDLEEEDPRNNARQALAQICIVTNPSCLPYSEQLDAVRPLLELLEHKHELLQFEGAMGLTNLLTVSEELRSSALQKEAWRISRDLLFSENEMVQRGGLEVMCNLCMTDEIIERFIEGRGEIELKVFPAFCVSEDRGTQLAASGALAMLAQYSQVIPHLVKSEHFDKMYEVLESTEDPPVEHRVVSILCCVAMAEEDVSAEVKTKALKALRSRRARKKGFVSKEAESTAIRVLDEDHVNGGA